VHALDAIELDVARGARPGDKGEWPAGALQGADRVGHRGDDLAALDDADVEVGHQGQRPAARTLAAVEDDRAGLGDGQRAAGDGAVERVEIARGEAAVLHQLEQRGAPRVGQADRDAEAARSVVGARLTDRGRDVVGLAHGGAIVRDALGEARDGVAARGRRRLVGRWLERLALRYVAQRVTDAREDLVTRAQTATSP
jgi:hypothetical protein